MYVWILIVTVAEAMRSGQVGVSSEYGDPMGAAWNSPTQEELTPSSANRLLF